MSNYRTPYDNALDAMLDAGISRGKADELLMAVFEQGQASLGKNYQPAVRVAMPRSEAEAEVATLTIDTSTNYRCAHTVEGNGTSYTWVSGAELAQELIARASFCGESLAQEGEEIVLKGWMVGGDSRPASEWRFTPNDACKQL